jgi:hypothetical protein
MVDELRGEAPYALRRTVKDDYGPNIEAPYALCRSDSD